MTATTPASFRVDLRAAPFHLDDEAVAWVESTIAFMTFEEKIGQLFINLDSSFEEDYLDEVVTGHQVGGLRFRSDSSRAIQDHLRYAQSRAKIPLLVASNPEMGGLGSADDGTLVCTHLQAGSHPDASIAYRMGQVAGVETAAMGCNWAFAPIVDIHLNWRNTVVATRSFGDDPDLVIERALAYFEGIRESGIACAIKHFPGDGVDERDQHVATTYNTLEVDEWEATFGKVYRALIDGGVPSIMAGHIGAPALSRRLRPGIRDSEIMPATLAPELLGDLLRGELGFNGLIVSDASLMVGFTQSLPRRELVPAAIAAGCDMFLFFRHPEEDLAYLRAGVDSGVVSAERLEDALRRVLGLKASLGLHVRAREDLVPGPEALEVVGSEAHRQVAAAIADQTVTLVKDTQGNLPLTPATHRRIRLYGTGGSADFTGQDPSGYLALFREELERAGFEVSVFGDRPDDAEVLDARALLREEATDDYRERYDAAILVANVTGFAQESSMRIRWSGAMSAEMPWYATEVPTVFVSTSLPNHLIDVPGIKTVVHAHAASRENIRATVEKLQGLSPFQGTHNDKVWCDTFGTRT